MSTLDVRLRERRETIATHVRAAVGHAQAALNADDPLTALGLLELAVDDLVAAAELARQAAVMATQARRGGAT